MKCDKCNTTEDQGANRVFECDSCKEMFVAVKQDHATQQVLEAAFDVISEIKALGCESRSFVRLYNKVKKHPDWESTPEKETK